MGRDTPEFKKMLSLADLIANEQIRLFARGFIIDVIPDYFFVVPSSSTGKYHPKFSLGDGGLARHTIAAVLILLDLVKLDYFRKSLTALDIDRMICATLLHDSFKRGKKDCGHSLDGHAAVAAQEINSALRVKRSRIAALVETHMGQWDYPAPESLPEFLVHLADYLASRKHITVDVT